MYSWIPLITADSCDEEEVREAGDAEDVIEAGDVGVAGERRGELGLRSADVGDCLGV